MHISRACLFKQIRYCLSVPFFVLVAETHMHTLPRSSFYSLRPSLHSARSAALSSLVLSLSNTRIRFISFFPSFSLFLSYTRPLRSRGMRTLRYYVMPADRESDILCMLMPHNVGFVPLFSIYLFRRPLPRSRPPLLSRTDMSVVFGLPFTVPESDRVPSNSG